MARRDKSNLTRFVIVGGGISGLTCAETLRQSNFTGEIMVLSNEKVLPYNRKMLTKKVATVDAEDLAIRKSEFLDEFGIEYYLNHEVASIEPENKAVRMKDGYRINYDKLLIATGGRATKIKNEGSYLKNIFTLRNESDQSQIKESAKDAKNIVVFGGGFIANETISCL